MRSMATEHRMKSSTVTPERGSYPIRRIDKKSRSLYIPLLITCDSLQAHFLTNIHPPSGLIEAVADVNSKSA